MKLPGKSVILLSALFFLTGCTMTVSFPPVECDSAGDKDCLVLVKEFEDERPGDGSIVGKYHVSGFDTDLYSNSNIAKYVSTEVSNYLYSQKLPVAFEDDFDDPKKPPRFVLTGLVTYFKIDMESNFDRKDLQLYTKADYVFWATVEYSVKLVDTNTNAVVAEAKASKRSNGLGGVSKTYEEYCRDAVKDALTLSYEQLAPVIKYIENKSG
ncbi:MAG: hypothetical protein ACYTG7_08625 [Planctomycetota bacterium]|jgi:hypothetical protein